MSTNGTHTVTTGVAHTTGPPAGLSTPSATASADTLAAPRQPRLVTVDRSDRRQINLSAGDSTTVTVRLTAAQSLSDVRISTTEPSGLTVTADPTVVTRLDADERTSHTFTVRADRPVSRTLNLVVRATRDDQAVSQRLSYSVDALDETDTGTRSSAVRTGLFATADAATPISGATNRTSAATATAGIDVSGQAAYTDPSGRVSGLAGVTVELYDVDGSRTQLASTHTAENGEFTFRLDPEADADGDNSIQALVVVYAENDAAYVSDGSSLYGFSTQPVLLDGGDSITLGADIDDDGSKELVAAGNNAPFQAVDWAYEAHTFGTDAGVSTSQVPIRYPAGDWAYFRYRTDGQQLIQLPERRSYPWDRTTVYHEYGHSIHFELRGYTAVETGQYSCHVQMSETDPGYALVEGFAEYYAAAVADNPNALSYGSQNIETNRFYDTQYTGQCANGDADGAYDGRSVEGSVASIFWDITDGGAGDDDPISYDFATIAETLRTDPGGMTEFYDAWAGGDEAALDAIYTDHGIDRLPPTVSYAVDDTPYTDPDVRLSGSVDDEREVTELALSVNGGPYRPIESTAGRWSVTRTLPNGTSTLSIRATDPGGFTREATETVRVSPDAPSVSIRGASASELTSSDASASVDFTYASRYPDTATVRVLQDGQTVASTSLSDLDGSTSGTDATATIELPATGAATVEIALTDDAGRTTTDRQTVTLRNERPATLAGDVVDETGSGIADATVRLYAVSDTDFSDPLHTTRTNSTGSYAITTVDGESLRTGVDYTVRASFDGTTTTRTVDTLASGVNEVDLTLSPSDAIALSDLSPTTATSRSNGTLTASVLATNPSEAVRTQSVVFRVAGTTVATRTVTLGPNADQTIVFEDVAIPELAPGEYSYSVSTDESRRTGTVTIEPSTTGSTGPVGRYDTNDDGEITRPELGSAAADYATDDLSRRELGMVAAAYAGT